MTPPSAPEGEIALYEALRTLGGVCRCRGGGRTLFAADARRAGMIDDIETFTPAPPHPGACSGARAFLAGGKLYSPY